MIKVYERFKRNGQQYYLIDTDPENKRQFLKWITKKQYTKREYKNVIEKPYKGKKYNNVVYMVEG